MSDIEIKQLLSAMLVIQQDMHELKYKYMCITVDNSKKLDKQLQDIQIRLMLLEAILKKYFGPDCIDDSFIFENQEK